MNNLTIVGRLTKDTELRFSKSNTAFCQFTVAVDEYRGKEKRTDYLNCVAFGKRAEAICNYTCKGSLVSVVGKVRTNPYEDSNGAKRVSTTVEVDDIRFLSKPHNSEDNNNGYNGNSGNSGNNGNHGNHGGHNDSGSSSNFGGFDDDTTPVDDGDMPF